jgi:homoserine O-acetyltransferase
LTQIEVSLIALPGNFVRRTIDANTYLYLTRAMDYFDLAADYDGMLAASRYAHPFLRDFLADWLFPTSDSRAIVHALNAASARVSLPRSLLTKVMTHSAREPELFAIVRGFLDMPQGARPWLQSDL